MRVSDRVTGTPTPTAERPEPAETSRAAGAFTASGSWVMSSLPGCLHERERSRGVTAQLRAQFPPQSERLASRTVVHAGDCTLVVGVHEVWLSRGADRLRVPREAELYRHAGDLTLVYVHGTHAEIRRYDLSVAAK